uniref:(northern house mosquito) hypothetical protein n=1 Tax=Culex pipiens TaxID=7175 RepID=A0A8D8ID46_CULPI
MGSLQPAEMLHLQTNIQNRRSPSPAFQRGPPPKQAQTRQEPPVRLQPVLQNVQEQRQSRQSSIASVQLLQLFKVQEKLQLAAATPAARGDPRGPNRQRLPVLRERIRRSDQVRTARAGRSRAVTAPVRALWQGVQVQEDADSAQYCRAWHSGAVRVRSLSGELCAGRGSEGSPAEVSSGWGGFK